MTTVSAIIVAAGKGRRMKAEAPKQYLMLDGLPILSRTLLAVDACPEVDDICLVVPESDMAYCRAAVLAPVRLRAPVKMVAGGAQRQESVYNGLRSLAHDDGIVLIHDGVRPFVRPDEIRCCIDAAKIHGACIPGLPVSDTLKAVGDGGDIIKTIDRDRLWRAQTPQTFQYRLIKDAHEKAKRNGVTGTDDASLLERIGETVRVVPGSIFNIKITTPEDLKMAEAIAGNFSYSHQ
jgi:2-C-methyl-D-erythritol 4-phosphate cytidylyltransferase